LYHYLITVAYDSSKGASNTYANFLSKTISENVNTCSCVLQALLGSSGIGNEINFSMTLNQNTSYISDRMGASASNPIGIVTLYHTEDSYD